MEGIGWESMGWENKKVRVNVHCMPVVEGLGVIVNGGKSKSNIIEVNIHKELKVRRIWIRI